MRIAHQSGGWQRLGCQPPCQLLGILATLVITVAVATPLRATEETSVGRNLEIRKGDHISLIGNTLTDRMQHDGWLETYLYSRFPTLGSTVAVFARALLYAAEVQLYALLYFSCQSPNKLMRSPRFTTSRGVTRQSS